MMKRRCCPRALLSRENEMARTHRLLTTGALVACLVGTQTSGTLFASEEPPSATSAGPAAAVSVSQQPSIATDPSSTPLSTAGRLRFTLDEHELAATAPA